MIICILGPTCAGKDYLANRMRDKLAGSCQIFRSGDECREHFGEAFMSKCANPNAPDEVEDFVRTRWAKMYSVAQQRKVPFISVGTPRRVDQVEWIVEAAEKASSPVLVMSLLVGKALQKERIADRDGEHPDRLELSIKKIEGGADRKLVDEVVKALSSRWGVCVIRSYSGYPT